MAAELRMSRLTLGVKRPAKRMALSTSNTFNRLACPQWGGAVGTALPAWPKTITFATFIPPSTLSCVTMTLSSF
jgi:hypothetical protein